MNETTYETNDTDTDSIFYIGSMTGRSGFKIPDLILKYINNTIYSYILITKIQSLQTSEDT